MQEQTKTVKMYVEIIQLINGTFEVRDKNDEAPMIRVQFLNEFSQMSNEDKVKSIKSLLDTFAIEP